MAESGISERSGGRAQSETIGVVLLFAVVLLSAGVIISFGVTAVNESEESLSADRAEKVMTQMDSEISMVALGRTDSQEISFDRVPGEQFSIDETSGQINITVSDSPREEVWEAYFEDELGMNCTTGAELDCGRPLDPSGTQTIVTVQRLRISLQI